MRIKGRKYISLVLMLMFLISFFPGYALAGEPLEPVQQIIDTSNTPEGTLGGEPEEQGNENLIQQQLPVIPEKVSLTINHILYRGDGSENLTYTETIEGLDAGNVVNGADYQLREEGVVFAGSQPGELMLRDGDNEISLLYDLILPEVVEQKEQEEFIPENPDGLSEFSDGFVSAKPFYYSSLPRMMMKAAPLGGNDLQPGEIRLSKDAVLLDENRWEVTLSIEGKGKSRTSDVVLVIDKSGSMEGSKMTNTIAAAQEFVDELLQPNSPTRIAVVAFDQDYHLVENFTSYEDKDALKNKIAAIKAQGATNIQAGIRQAHILLDASTADNKNMVLLGDGQPTKSYLVNGASDITVEHVEKTRWIIWPVWSEVYYEAIVSGIDSAEITDIDYTTIVGDGSSYFLKKNQSYKIPCTQAGCENATNGNHYTGFPADNGVPTIYEAKLAQDAGIDIYSIAMQAGANGQYVLKNCQNAGYYQLDTSDLSSLGSVFNQIAGKIALAASNGEVVDPIGDMFNLVLIENESPTVSQGVFAVNPDNGLPNRIINWNVGDILDGKIATLSYVVELNPELLSEVLPNEYYPTNGTTTFDYYNEVTEQDESKSFVVPEVQISLPVYTVTWIVDGSSTDETYAYGATPSFKGSTDKAADEQYTYTFTGWDPAIVDVVGDATYTAQYSAETKNYTVTWIVDGNSTEETYAYGATPSFKGSTDKAADEQYTYTFTGWDPAIVDVVGDATYTAQYSAETKNYTVTWVVDGSSTDETYAYGATPSFKGSTDKAADEQYTYTFTGWDPAIVDVVGDATYTAQYSAETKNYTVTWIVDGSSTDETYAYGATPSFKGSTDKAADEQYTYTFTGWDPAIVDVVGDATYTAQYSAETNNYTVTWIVDGSSTDETYAYGATPSFKGSTDKAADEQYTYTFTGWDPAIVDVVGDATYTAQYSAETKNYTVTWVVDGSSTDETYAYGATPSFKGSTDKAADEQYTYTFTGWDPAIVDVVGDATYTAQYSAETKNYTVTWIVDGSSTDETYAYGATPSFKGSTDKAADEQYTYTFTGWDPAIVDVVGDATYTAQYSAETKNYTVTWIVDGSSTDETYAYGATPSFKGSTDKAADEQYTYTFTGWDPAIVDVVGDATYTAQYSAETNNYTVTWIVDGSSTDETYAYGATPSFKGSTDKAADEQYTYTFTGWDPAIVDVVGDATYTAQYSAETNNYTVTWIVDGSSTDETYAYGATPSFKGSTDKAADEQYTYTFTGWDPAIVDVVGDATYTAQYSAETKNYTVTWIVDGSSTDETYAYGATPSFKGSTDKAADEQYTYTFTGWDPAIVDVVGDATYTAQYSAETKNYTVTWIVDGSSTDETYAYGATPSFKGSTDKAADEQYTYTFTGWDPAIVDVVGDATYTAQYSAETKNYTVTWIVDGSSTDETYAYGATPSFKGSTDKAADEQYTYTFTGWDPAIVDVVGDATYTAQYSAETKNYTVTWVVDGSSTDETYAYGATPSFKGSTDKAADEQYTYTFTGWDPAIVDVVGDATYTAQYSAETKNYTVTWIVDGSSTDETYAYGATPSFKGSTDKAADEQYTYTFTGWDPAIVDVVGDATYTAQYSAETKNYTVTWIVDGSSTDETYAYGATPSFKGSTDKAADEQYTYTFTGWDPAIVDVVGDATYTAQYRAETNNYTVTFEAGANGSLTGETIFENILHGTAWADALTVPTPAANSGYKFDSWTPGFPTTVTESATYTAKFVRTGGSSGPSGGGPSGGTAPEEPIEVPEEPEVAIPLNKDDHFAYVVGYPDNTVQPLGKITREEVAAVFYRLLEDEYRETIKTDSSDFPDVGLDRWSSKHIGTLASVDIIIGYPDGNFQPGNTITRAELATIASKFDNLSPFEDNSFSDIEGHWANKYINSAAQKGWVSGYPDGTFKPDQAITRAEFVTLVNKVLERKVLKEDILPDAKQFPDLSPNAWYYVEVQEAVNSHHYERATRQDYEIWTDIYYPELDM